MAGRLVDAVRQAWKARVPATVGGPPGRLLLPIWPFAVLAGLALLNLVTGAAPAVLAASGVGPALLSRARPLLAGLSATVANVVVVLAVLAGVMDMSFPSWLYASGLLQLLAAYVIALALAPRVAAVVNVGLALSGAAAVEVSNLFPPGGAGPMWLALVAVAGLLGARRAATHAMAVRRIAEDEERRVLDERARIARELHDVVAHHMSAMAVRAASAPHRIDGLPEPARQEFAEVAAGAREALAELRQLLGVLRGTAEPDLAPQPGLADVPTVVERTRKAGTPVELELDPDLAPGAVVDVSAYRIVQEALSNVTRHATGARTHVRVGRRPGGLVVEVRNDRPAAAPTPGPGGHGLAGMRERVRLLGGRLDAGPTEDGGFAVRAELPAEQAP